MGAGSGVDLNFHRGLALFSSEKISVSHPRCTHGKTHNKPPSCDPVFEVEEGKLSGELQLRMQSMLIR